MSNGSWPSWQLCPVQNITNKHVEHKACCDSEPTRNASWKPASSYWCQRIPQNSKSFSKQRRDRRGQNMVGQGQGPGKMGDSWLGDSGFSSRGACHIFSYLLGPIHQNKATWNCTCDFNGTGLSSPIAAAGIYPAKIYSSQNSWTEYSISCNSNAALLCGNLEGLGWNYLVSVNKIDFFVAWESRNLNEDIVLLLA